MSLSPGVVRSALRMFHLVVAAIGVVALYVPVIPHDTARSILGVFVMPVLALSGVAMWQQAKLRKLLRGDRGVGRGRAGNGRSRTAR